MEKQMQQNDSAENQNLLSEFMLHIDSNPLPAWPQLKTNQPTTSDVYSLNLPWLILNPNYEIPHEAMLREALAVQQFFVLHRRDAWMWKSLCLYGISHAHTELLSDYGIEETPENLEKFCDYTDICRKLCPTTLSFLKNTVGYSDFTRVRFMLIEPGGYILPHKDQEKLNFGSLNIVLSHPEGCRFMVEPFGEVPLKPGNMFLFANGYKHAVYNQSSQPRVHMLIHGGKIPSLWNPLIVESAKKQLLTENHHAHPIA
jgi:Aspartyl/Asparaginyl beta-hydroxylase